MLQALGLADLDLTRVLVSLDGALAAAVLLTSFSLMVYVLTHNVYSPVGRAFTALMAFVTVVYVGDVAVINSVSPEATSFWLRFQWLGIAFVPAAYLHLSHALLRSVNRRAFGGFASVAAGYGIGMVLLALTVFTDLLVWDGVFGDTAAHLKAGPLFWVFSFYFAATTVLGAANIAQARHSAVTTDLRRRLTYLALSFVAPALGVFPFLIVAGMPGQGTAWVVHALSAAGSAAVMGMLIVMAYSVAYYGVLAPERVVKQEFTQYLLRGPLMGVLVLMVMLAVPQGMQVMGLRRSAFLVFAVVGVVVMLPVVLGLAQPLLDRFAYRQDRAEVAWLRELERRLLTTTDFRQVMENILISACEAARANGGFIAALPPGDIGELQVQATIGEAPEVPELPEVAGWLQECSSAWAADEEGEGLNRANILSLRGYWLMGLLDRNEGLPLGVMGLLSRREPAELEDEDLALLDLLVAKASAAIEDMRLQRQVFAALQRLLPEIASVQRWRDDATYGHTSAMLANPVLSPEFPSLVRAALRHYWGGPELRESPLLQLRVVREAMRENGGNPIRALRAVLVKAIEALRPAGERGISSEWVLYNVLEMKYVQGLRAKEIARRLAVSESDLYRKQRVAVKEMARVLAEMEIRASEPSE
ncbi:MAG: histidine kinase N-terminal 7TM domain-containing protein [Anaerolineae bacterium]|jgi:GAF domain-containing protein